MLSEKIRLRSMEFQDLHDLHDLQDRLPAPILLFFLSKSNIISETSLSLSQQKAQLRCRGFHSFFTQNLGCAATASDRWVAVAVVTMLTQNLRFRSMNLRDP
ncbi:hypothetical protein CMV_000478 [Castanea mollissima]|uniref:Uncharacterized protein n=1 Tax=Castanea mollissima TaxID=60419 RepID=A0A8J4RMA0_9ROSI|nr:hypothetical protein CMV_000478 [Castanea mollissima]